MYAKREMKKLFEDFIDDIDVQDATENEISVESAGDISDFAILVRLAASNILPSLTSQKIIKQVHRVLSKYGDEDECSAICVRPNAAYPECVWSDGRDESFTIPEELLHTATTLGITECIFGIDFKIRTPMRTS